jgi:short-subunit dehydrogenase
MGFFAEIPMEKNDEMIHLNVLSLVQMTHLFLKDMLKRNNGKILQLASVASYQPTPLLAVYAATKAFVLSFSDALANELKDSGITVTALIPNATDTNFFNRADAEDTKAAQNNPEDPAVVAQVGFDALMKGDLHAVAPGVTTQIAMSSLMSNEKVAAKARKQMETDPKSKVDESIH